MTSISMQIPIESPVLFRGILIGGVIIMNTLNLAADTLSKYVKRYRLPILSETGERRSIIPDHLSALTINNVTRPGDVITAHYRLLIRIVH